MSFWLSSSSCSLSLSQESVKNKMRKVQPKNKGNEKKDKIPEDKISSEQQNSNHPDWKNLPVLALILIFKNLKMHDRARAAGVCQNWYKAYQMPQLWQSFEFVIGQARKSCMLLTPPTLIKYVLEKHAKHLRFLTLKLDSSRESAEMACHILAQLVDCSLKTLGLISSAKSSFLMLEPDCFASALTLVIDRSHALSSLAIDETPVDDPSLQHLAARSCNSLELLRMKSCPHVSAKGIQAVADHCHRLCELALNYSLLSNELLLALSSEEHARLKFLRIDISTKEDLKAVSLHHISPNTWNTLVKHSPSMALVMYIFVSQERDIDNFFDIDIPATHLYFGNFVPKSTLAKVAEHCPHLVELVISSNGNSNIDTEVVAIAQKCQNLTSLGLGVCEVSCSALVELARICGSQLKELCILEESVTEDENYDLSKACFEVSHFLGREWAPDDMPVW